MSLKNSEFCFVLTEVTDRSREQDHYQFDITETEILGVFKTHQGAVDAAQQSLIGRDQWTLNWDRSPELVFWSDPGSLRALTIERFLLQ